MKLNTQAVYSLNEAIIKLHDAARQVDEKTAEQIREISDEVEAIKEWGEGKIRGEQDWRDSGRDKACDFI